jgi:hypothetical protein
VWRLASAIHGLPGPVRFSRIGKPRGVSVQVGPGNLLFQIPLETRIVGLEVGLCPNGLETAATQRIRKRENADTVFDFSRFPTLFV